MLQQSAHREAFDAVIDVYLFVMGTPKQKMEDVFAEADVDT
jgi:hypothetical protein